MARYNVIAGVSRTLQNLLKARMDSSLVTVTISPPDITVDGTTGNRLNLYLYHLAENAHLKNQQILGIGQPTEHGPPPRVLYGHASLALNLHYLVTAYSAQEADPSADLDAQAILGDAMRVFHDYSILPSADFPPGDSILDNALTSESESLKIALVPLGLDDISKLWSTYPEVNFRRSVAYEVSVVQIESDRARTYPRPVGAPPAAGPRVYAVPIRSPQIRELRVIRGEDTSREELTFPFARVRPATTADALVLYGSNLGSADTRFQIGPVGVSADASGERAELNIPDDPVLRPGPQTVRAIQDITVLQSRGDPAVESPRALIGFQSNVCVFVLVPWIDTVVLAGTSLTVTGTRLFSSTAESLAIVGDTVIHSVDYTAIPSSTSITFPVSLPPGTYPVRVRVNGAESIPEGSVTVR